MFYTLIKDIYLDEKNQVEVHNILKNSSIKSIKENPLFDNSIWDTYAKKDAAFLMLESEIPHLMDDVPSKKLAASSLRKTLTKPLYKKRQLSFIPLSKLSTTLQQFLQDICYQPLLFSIYLHC